MKTKYVASHQEHFRQIAQTQLIAQAPQHDQQHNIRRKLKVVECCASPFIEAPPAVMASIEGITQLRCSCRLARLSRLAVWTIHLAVLSLIFPLSNPWILLDFPLEFPFLTEPAISVTPDLRHSLIFSWSRCSKKCPAAFAVPRVQTFSFR